MKALSIQQPWAWAILHAGKDVENRTWVTCVRGRIVIHAGEQIDREAVDWLRMRGYDVPINLPTGGIVGEVTITNCLSSKHPELSGNPWAFGPVCFTLKDPNAYESLIPMTGALGFFEVGDPKEATR